MTQRRGPPRLKPETRGFREACVAMCVAIDDLTAALEAKGRAKPAAELRDRWASMFDLASFVAVALEAGLVRPVRERPGTRPGTAPAKRKKT